MNKQIKNKGGAANLERFIYSNGALQIDNTTLTLCIFFFRILERCDDIINDGTQ